MVELQDGGLLFAGVNLMMTTPDPTYGYRIRVMHGDTEFGDPDAVISEIQSQLQDGDLQRVDRYGNRTAVLDVRIDAPGSAIPGAAVAAGQAAVELAAGFTGWAELQWTSRMSAAETSVMEMTSAIVGKKLDTSRENNDGTRIIKITIGARPFVRPTTKDTFSAPATIGSTTTSVDTGSATTGWSMLSTAPAALTNVETNPDFATNVTGYSAGGGTGSITATTDSGRSVAQVNTSGTGAAFNGRSYINGPLHTVTAGRSMVIGSIQQTGAFSPYMTIGALVRWYSDTAGTTQVGSDVVLTATGGNYVTRTWSLTVPAGVVRARVYRFQQNLSSTSSSPWYLDKQWTILSDSGVSSYFDGATANTTALTYAWTGTAGNSTSTATWTAPALAVVSGAVQGTVYGRASASIRRNNTGITSAAMATLTYIRIRGTATASATGQITIADNGGPALTPTSYSYNATTGAFDILIQRAAGFTNLDVTFTDTSGTISTTSGVFVAVDQIDITDNPFATGKVQTRQITIGGSQRTELSLSILGLDAAGTTPVGLGDQILIHTAAKGTDARAKFLACRAASGLGGTPESTFVSGQYNILSTTATPTNFPFPASTLVPGNYLTVARIFIATAGNKTLSFRAFVDPSTGDNVYDPPGGTAWKTAPVLVGTTGWPAIANGGRGTLPLGLLRLPPADFEDTGATLTIQLAVDTASSVYVDDIYLCNVDVGQTSLIRGDISGGYYSAIRLDAATLDNPAPSAWVGVANGTMISDPTRLLAFEQHQASPGILQASSVTPNCATSRLAGSFYRHYGHDVAPKAGA